MDNQLFIKRVWMPDGTCVSAHLVYRDKPTLILESGSEIVDDKNEITYEMTHEFIVNEKGKTVQVPLRKPVQVYLTPRFIAARKYTKSIKEEDLDIYPPSTNGFYGRFIRGTTNAIYIVHNTVESQFQWLAIVESNSMTIQEQMKLRRFECDVIRLKTWYDVFDDLVESFSSPSQQKLVNEILSSADETELSWEEIYDFTGGTVSPSFSRRATSRETLNQLVPMNEFPKQVRDQILAFLVWAIKRRIPEGDIIDFVNSTYSIPLFRGLLISHLIISMSKTSLPIYADIIKESALGKSRKTESLLEEREIWSPDYLLRKKIESLVPDLQPEIMDIVTILNNKNRITTVYPVSKTSVFSQEAQKKRLIMWETGLRLRAHIRPPAFGLKELIYIGAAYRWPHWHLAYSIRLGPRNLGAQYAQGMVMPVSAAERVNRILHHVYNIDWSAYAFNTSLYNQKNKAWNVKQSSLLNLFDKKYSLEKLKSEFGYWRGTEPYRLTRQEARVIDMANSFFYLSDLEHEEGRKYWGTNEDESRKLLEKLQKQGAISIVYWYGRMPDLSRVFVKIGGSEDTVCSITRGFLKYVPTSLVRIANSGETSFILFRVPIKERDLIIDTLSDMAKNNDIDMEIKIPSALRNYQADLYQRLLNSDGSLNNDVSGLLSQARSIPKSVLDDIKQG